MADNYSTDDASKLKAFIARDIVRDQSVTLTDDQPLMSSGLVDSFALVDLSLFIENTFGVRVPDIDLTPERMDTVAKILTYVGKLRRNVKDPAS